ncbi:MAG: bifunctional diaminohydroxyphosphoribosylaminopyrimidine deaminase/5-amino-6-(5-phosphoribosylamino)uracil reductase RibD [Niabella sp.]
MAFQFLLNTWGKLNSFIFAHMELSRDNYYMARCLQLARLGAGRVAPNPMVGAVLVHDDVIIGEGYHQKYGEAHAEVNCINEALQNNPDKISKSTLYVSLEPCAHYGKTPPCADLIISHKIPKVVVGCRDSFKEVDGRGIAKLREAGIEVVENILEDECIDLNKQFFTFHEYSRPYVILKWAQTQDGFIATDHNDGRLMISGEYTNRLVHKWRSENPSILVGSNTVVLDNPLLDNRYWFGQTPLKLVLDTSFRLLGNFRIFYHGADVWVFNTATAGREEGIKYFQVSKENVLHDMLSQLHAQNIQSVFVEGGKTVLQSFIDVGLWDEARVITNTTLCVGQGLNAPVMKDSAALRSGFVGNDYISFFKNKNNAFIRA